MSLADWKADSAAGSQNGPPVVPSSEPRPLHRVARVRQQQGVSLRSAARRMKMDQSELRALEHEESDMPLSMLYRWQQALEVPITDLLVEQEAPLSAPVMQRARMVRLMKTAAAIRAAAKSDQIRRMTDMLIEQLVEIMPELKEVSPWHTVGQRRSLDELGRCAERPVSDDWFNNHNS
jgi:transcriptional regulator with XRE-family HTH domain